jgi:hypothetical protein
MAGIYRAINLVLADDYPDNLSHEDAFEVTADDVKCAWNNVNLSTFQRIAFEGDKLVNKVCMDIMGWKIQAGEDSDDEETDEDETDFDIQCRGMVSSQVLCSGWLLSNGPRLTFLADDFRLLSRLA